MLANGVATVTTDGPFLSCDLKQAVALANDPGAAFKAVRLWQEDAGSSMRYSKAGLEYMKRFTWEEIADRHLKLYDSLNPERASKG